jgi:hypothetical protein
MGETVGLVSVCEAVGFVSKAVGGAAAVRVEISALSVGELLAQDEIHTASNSTSNTSKNELRQSFIDIVSGWDRFSSANPHHLMLHRLHQVDPVSAPAAAN